MIEKYAGIHSTDKIIRWLFLLGFILHITAAIFSEGFHKLDEQEGIMRFVGLKLGLLDSSAMSREYPWQIRPWAQPFIYFSLGKIFPVSNPFTLNFIFRLFSSLLGLYSIVLLFKHFKQFLKHKTSELTYLSFLILLWYFPFFHARPTSENFSISFFIYGFTLLILERPKYWQYLLSGFLLGFSFYFRFQSSIMITSSVLWLLIFGNLKIRPFFILMIGFLLSIGCNTLIDYWGYGEWVFTPWKYLDFNIIQGGAAQYGVDPWYIYIKKTFIKGIPPFSLLLIIPYFYLWSKAPKSLITWITLPFFLVHSCISHKELRFLFGLGLFAPLAISLFLEAYPINSNKLTKALYKLALLLNLGALLIATLKPAASQINYYKTIYQEKIPQIYYFNTHPKKLPFYNQQGIEYLKTENPPNVADYHFVTMNPEEAAGLKKSHSCQIKYSKMPQWVNKIFPKKWLKRSRNWLLWQCKRTL